MSSRPSFASSSTSSALIWALVALAWGTLLATHSVLHSDPLLRLLGWQIMLAAMMLPSVIPVFQAVALLSSRWIDRAAFILPYWGLWSVFSLILLWQPYLEVRASHAHSALTFTQGAILIGAGLFQLTPLKQACLKGCQSAIATLLIYYEQNIGSIVRLGLRYALNCLGCCWFLMLTMLVVGMGNLALMVILTMVMVIERQWQYGSLFSLCVGAILIVSGSVLLILL